ncbi:MAG: hypothetical protein COU72_01135 [Parcubacteria group bacterium CG10_big_fil_rev_8_21_14_0_10_41_35]|nr:MAG: hypothetical protein COU72_01135 [Parcubacteria group bacterium CG10_big_fil_rev_8_21_14_0_10_41_35]
MRQSAKPVGLSGEFSSFSISDFRSFGNSSQAAEKILSKIKSLEMDSIAQKYAAIRNFHSSPLYQKYISIGEASLTQGKKLSEALLDPNINQDKITQEEFFAISDLNGKLR